MGARTPQIQAGSKTTANNLRVIARIVSGGWVFWVAISTVCLVSSWSGGSPPDSIWFALYFLTVVIAAAIPLVWVRVGGVILVAHGLAVLIFGLGYLVRGIEGGSLFGLVVVALIELAVLIAMPTPFWVSPQIGAGVMYILSARPAMNARQPPSAAEVAFVEDAKRVLDRLASVEEGDRLGVLAVLGVPGKPALLVVSAVTILAAFDPSQRVRDAAGTALARWEVNIPASNPDGLPQISAQRIRDLAAPEIVADAEGRRWEQRPFVFAWPHRTWNFDALLARDQEVARHEANIRKIVWEECGPRIEAEMQKMGQEGWAPMEEAGPSTIQLKTFSELGRTGCLWQTASVIMGSHRTLQSSFASTRIEPVELRVMMRRKLVGLQD
jgi:hypothetical protein